MEPAVSPRIYRFGPFELSRDAAELRKNGIRLKLQDQPFQILCTLLDHSGELVTREQLCQQLWPDGTFVDFEHGLNTAIKKLRDVLSDDTDTPRYIETIPRKGYRFIGSLNESEPRVATSELSVNRSPVLRRRICFAVTLIISIIVAVTFYSLTRPRFVRITGTRQLTFRGEVRGTPRTDGIRVYFSGNKQADSNIYSIPVTGGDAVSFPTQFRLNPDILDLSPDHTRLLLKPARDETGDSEAQLWVFSVTGGPGRPVGDITASDAAWMPDGRRIVFARGKALFLTDENGSITRKVVDTPQPILASQWLPGGKRLLLSLFDEQTFKGSLWETALDGTRREAKLGLPGADVCCGVPSRDGRYLFFHRIYEDRSEYWSIDKTWFPFRRRVPTAINAGGLEIVSLTPSPTDNTLFAVGFQISGLAYFYERATGKLSRLLPGISVTYPRFSLDGQWLVFVQQRNSQRILWRSRANGSELMQLTDPKLWVVLAAFSPDGKRVALMGKWPGRPYKIYWVSVDGGTLHELNAPIDSQGDPNWTPDGESIIFGQPPQYMAEPGKPRAIYAINVRTGALTKIFGSDGWFSPRLSADGRLLAAVSIDEHRIGIFNIATQQWRIFFDRADQIVGHQFWSHDSHWLYFSNGGRERWKLMRLNAQTAESQELVSLRDLTEEQKCYCYSLAPDGRLLISCLHYDFNLYALKYE